MENFNNTTPPSSASHSPHVRRKSVLPGAFYMCSCLSCSIMSDFLPQLQLIRPFCVTCRLIEV